MIEYYLNFLNNSKIFAGCVMLLMNIGSKYIFQELPENIDYIFNRKWIRIFIIFCIIFVSTKDIKTSILITLLFILLFKFILDENSQFCVIEKRPTKVISKQEANKALQLLKSYKTQNNT